MPGNIGEEYRGEQASWEKCACNILKWKGEASKIVLVLKEKKNTENRKKPKTNKQHPPKKKQNKKTPKKQTKPKHQQKKNNQRPNQTVHTYFSFSFSWAGVILNTHI